MGVVYKARDISLNRIVAIKMILAGVHASDESLARFRTEAEAVAQLTHRGIVQVYDVGQADGQPYCALEYIDGGGLDDLMAAESMSNDEAVAIVEELAHAMSSAHQAGIVHRDLKPANVLISSGGNSGSSINIETLGKYRPKITDFGLAKKVEQESQQTRTGAIMGTPGYMAPEQARGAKRIGPAADIYSLGAILFHLVTGKPPFAGETPIKTIMQVINDPPPTPRSLNATVDRDLDTIILKCLEKNPSARYASAEHLAQDLHRYQTGMPIEARPVSRIERMSKWVRRKPWAAAMIGLSAIALIGLLIGGAIFNRRLATAYDEVDAQHTVAVQALNDKSIALEAESRALEAESNALNESDKARQRAEASEAQSRRRLIDNFVNNGLQSMTENRMLQSLPWLSESLSMETDPDRLAIHQLRFNMAVQNSPKPDRTWLTDSAVVGCSFSDDGKQVASFSMARKIVIHDIENNQEIESVTSPSQILAFEITGDHKRAALVSGFVDAANGNMDLLNIEFRSWDVETGVLGQPFPIQVNEIQNPDFKPLVSAERNWLFYHNTKTSSAELVDLTTHQSVHAFELNSDDFEAAMHPSGNFVAWRDGEKLVVRDTDNPDESLLEIDLSSKKKDAVFGFLSAQHFAVNSDKLRIYDLTKQPMEEPTSRSFTNNRKGIPRISIAAESGCVAVAWSNGQLELFDGNGMVIDRQYLNSDVQELFFSNDEQTLLVATRNEILRISALTGDAMGSPIPATLKPLLSAAIAPDDLSVVVSSGSGIFIGSGCLRIWDISSKGKSVSLNSISDDERVSRIRVHSNGKLIASLKRENGAVDIYNIANRNRPKKVLTLCGETDDPDSRRVNSVTWSRSGEQISVSMKDQIRLYEIPSGKELLRCPIDNPGLVVLNQDSSRAAVAYSKPEDMEDDKRQLVAIVDTIDGSILQEGLKHKGDISDLRFVKSPDNNGPTEDILVTLARDLNFRSFDAVTGKRLEKENLKMVPHTHHFERNNKWLMVGGERLGDKPGRAIAVSLEDGKPINEPIDFDRVVMKVRLNRAADRLAVSDDNGLVRILNPNSGADQGVQMVHPAPVSVIDFSHDGRILLTVCEDGKVRIFDVRSGLLLKAPFGGPNSGSGTFTPVRTATFLGDSYDVCLRTDNAVIMPTRNQKFTPEHATALSRFLSGLVISDRGTIVPVPANSLKADFSSVTIRQMMDANLLQHLIKQ